MPSYNRYFFYLPACMQAVARPFFLLACMQPGRARFSFPALMQQLELAVNIFHDCQKFSCPPIFSSGIIAWS
jgi:hypothetical protein